MTTVNFEEHTNRIRQYERNGKYLRGFENCEEAEGLTGVDARLIWACAFGERISAGGFIWRAVDDEPFDEYYNNIWLFEDGVAIKKYKTLEDIIIDFPVRKDKIMQALENEKELYGCKFKFHPEEFIVVCDKKNDKFYRFESEDDAVSELGLDKSNLRRCLRGERKTVDGYYAYKRDYSERLKAFSPRTYEQIWRFDSTRQAALALDIKEEDIKKHLEGKLEEAGGYIWTMED